MLDAYRIRASAGSVTDKALEEIIFRASHGVLRSLVNYYAGLKGRVATQRRAHPADDLPRGRGDNGRPVVTPLFYVFALGLLLAGCTSVVPVSKAGGTEAEWRQVDYVCLRETKDADTRQRARRLYEACLRANGWTVGEDETGVARRTYEYKP